MSIAEQITPKSNGSRMETGASPTAAQQQNPVPFAEASEIMTKIAYAVLQRQAAFVQGEALASMKGSALSGNSLDQSNAVTTYLDTVHGNLERAVAEARAMQDIIRDGVWQIFSLYAAFLPHATQRTES